jgi:hypothetical protein
VLVVEQRRVFVTVSGVTTSVIVEALTSQQMKRRETWLPLLEQAHLANVVSTFLPEVDVTAATLLHVLWWVGGVPSFLESAIQVAATLAGAVDDGITCLGERSRVAQYLSGLDVRAATDLVGELSWKLYQCTLVLDSALGGAVCFAVLGALVPGSLALYSAGDKRTTVEDVIVKRLLHWTASKKINERGGILGQVMVPPLILHWIQQRLYKYANRVTHVVYFVPFQAKLKKRDVCRHHADA